jgi:Putative metallopeptidase
MTRGSPGGIAAWGSERTMAIRMRCICALAGALLAGPFPAAAQMAPPQAGEAAKARSAQFQARVDEAVNSLEKDPHLKDLTPRQRRDLIEFVTGNLLFAALHEMGHMHIAEMGLPVLGREEDAADSYAITALLKVATDVSHDVLVAAAKGWFLDAARNEKEKTTVPFYDEHSIDKVRAYQIVCLMVGSDPDKFTDLANLVKMPEDRQESCAGDYSNASWSWETVLKPHLRAPDQPKQKIAVRYGPSGEYAGIAQAIRTIGMLEMLADYAANRFVWRRPVGFEAKSCGEANLIWDLSAQKILVCYEIAQDFANLYRDYGLNYVMNQEMNQKTKKRGSTGMKK